MRGFKVNIPLTRNARTMGTSISRDGGFESMPPLKDKRSFISLDGHFVLYGKDKGPARAEVFRINREKNGEVNKCWNCGRVVVESEEDFGFDLGFQVGEWDHIDSKRRCDCPGHNGRVACRNCHRKRHVQVKWSKTA